ncbi:DsrE family protein [Henriciella aquimarina]|uniref:DsrE family protein n=1 Tax=Henriciella aquimarina TaxID=545261 RepID=UPI001F4370CC|nr:DsrE family protein [Henriciella aquimarina]
MKPILLVTALAAACLFSAQAQTADQGFVKGPVFEDYGPAAQVGDDLAIPADLDLKVAFDISEGSEDGKINRRFETVARFMNMHATAGVPRDQLHPAIVVHGAASKDLLQPEAGSEASPTYGLIRALLDEGVPIYLCGQTVAVRGIDEEDLIPGVQVALSAMTAHAVLASEGYSLNPF